MLPWINVAFSAACCTALVAGGLSLARQPLSALPDYTEKERKECDFCHPAGDLFALNEAGRYYAEHNRSLKGYEPPGKSPAESNPAPVPAKAKAKAKDKGKSK